jgi:Family of unknown function (DUF6644)
VLEWFQWLEQTPVALAISESTWLFPLIEGTHILALPVSVGMILMLDLRLLGLAFVDGAPSRILHGVLRLSKAGFAVMFLTGIALFLAHAGKAYGNSFFRTKLIFLLLLGINAALFQVMFYPRMEQWDASGRTPAGAKWCAAISLVLWIGVIVCGRTMAYEI